MTTPICLECRRLMRCVKTGEYLLLMTEEVDQAGELVRVPYQIWAGDTYECPSCGARAVASFADRPMAERSDSDFDLTIARIKPTEIPV